eukprot:5082538-Amphidinium_carterae.3
MSGAAIGKSDFTTTWELLAILVTLRLQHVVCPRCFHVCHENLPLTWPWSATPLVQEGCATYLGSATHEHMGGALSRTTAPHPAVVPESLRSVPRRPVPFQDANFWLTKQLAVGVLRMWLVIVSSCLWFKRGTHLSFHRFPQEGA